MRLFFGVMPTKETKTRLNNVILGLKDEYDGKYTIEDNLHITLVFLGEVEEKLSHMLSDLGDKAFSNVDVLSAQGHRIDSFKDGKITYFAIDKNNTLDAIYNRLTSLLDTANMVYNKEEKYVPHITLRRGSKVAIQGDIEPIDIEAEALCLYESKRVDGVLRYIPIKTWMLKRGNNGY